MRRDFAVSITPGIQSDAGLLRNSPFAIRHSLFRVSSPPMSKSSGGETKFLGSAKIIAACTLLSRITGLARDILMNRAFGQGWEQDAFVFGFAIPNLFRRLFGEGALSAVFVPVFTEVLDKKGRPAA